MKAILRVYREAYRGLPREVWLLSAAFLVSRSGSMVVSFLTLYLTKVRGYSLEAAGQVLAVHGMGQLAGAFVGGWLCDRIGPIRTQILSLVFSGLGFLVLERLRTLPEIMATTFLVAVAAVALTPANLTALAAFSPPRLRLRAIALNRMALSLGLAIGASVGGWLAMRDYSLIFRVEGGACLAAAVLLVVLFRGYATTTTVRSPSEVTHSSIEVHPLRDHAFLAFLGLTFLATLIILQAWCTYPVFLVRIYGMTEGHYGLLMTLNGLLMLLFEMVITHSTARFRPLTMAGIGTFLVGLGFAILPLGSTAAFAVVSMVVWTTGDMLGTPAAGGWVARRAGPLHRGKYMGLYAMTSALGWVVAPTAGAFLYQELGPDSLWFTAGVLGGGLWAGFGLLGLRERRAGTRQISELESE